MAGADAGKSTGGTSGGQSGARSGGGAVGGDLGAGGVAGRDGGTAGSGGVANSAGGGESGGGGELSDGGEFSDGGEPNVGCKASSCPTPCTACGSDGRCNDTPDDDSRCETIACPASTACVEVLTLSKNRCVSHGTCATMDECEARILERGTECDSTRMCDGSGNCSLVRNGFVCESDDECGGGHCVRGVCGDKITECEQLTSSYGLVEVDDILSAAWPSTNVAGGATLLGGGFEMSSLICYDDAAVDTLYNDGSDLMVAVPAAASVGEHTLRAVASDGAVSRPLRVAVTATASMGVTYVASGSDVEVPAFGAPPQLVVPVPVNVVDPVANQWLDPYMGERWTSGPDGINFTGVRDFGDSKPGFVGVPDAGTKRWNIRFTRGDKSWAYVGLFSCPERHLIESPLSHVMFDICTFDLHTLSKMEQEMLSYPRVFVMFPVLEPAPQAVLKFGN